MTKRKEKLPGISMETLEEAFGDAARQLSLRTQLVEACQWDEDRAIDMLDCAFRVYEDLYEYSQHDPDLITDYPQFLTLVRVNLEETMKDDVTDAEFDAVLELIDHEIVLVLEKFNAESAMSNN